MIIYLEPEPLLSISSRPQSDVPHTLKFQCEFSSHVAIDWQKCRVCLSKIGNSSYNTSHRDCGNANKTDTTKNIVFVSLPFDGEDEGDYLLEGFIIADSTGPEGTLAFTDHFKVMREVVISSATMITPTPTGIAPLMRYVLYVISYLLHFLCHPFTNRNRNPNRNPIHTYNRLSLLQV